MNKPVVQSELLLAGASSYPQAFAAVSEFVRAIQAALRESLEKELPYLSKSMGVQVPAELKARLQPAKLAGGGVDGVNAKIGFAIWGDPDWRQYFYVNWKKDTLSISASVKFLRNLQAPVLAKAKINIAEARYKTGVNEKEFFIELKIVPGDITLLGVTMCELVRVWAEAWRNAGGLKPFLTEAV